jgi:hypothetical protein
MDYANTSQNPSSSKFVELSQSEVSQKLAGIVVRVGILIFVLVFFKETIQSYVPTLSSLIGYS